MSHESNRRTSRRQFLKRSSQLAGASALLGMTTPLVHAAADETIRVALVGCGGRGTGAASNALAVENGPLQLVAMADVFEPRLNSSYQNLKKQFGDQVAVPPEHRFVGFDSYRAAMDCLRPGDIVIMATPPAFRWVHFQYAIEKGLNVFMEKPVTVDAPTTKKMLALAEAASAKNLKVGVGLMWRHCQARQQLVDRVRDGEIGDPIVMRAYRLHGPIGFFESLPKPAGITEPLYQVQRFHSFLWASGGCFSDFYIHNIDELCWLKGAWPVEAAATGGRHYREYSLDQSEISVDQNFDNYSVEYTFADGGKLFMIGRCINGCDNLFGDFIHGTKGLGTIDSNTTGRGTCRTYRGQNPVKDQLIWRAEPEPSPYQLEWNDLVAAIKSDTPYNEAERGAIASLVTSMGRMAAHTGRTVTYEEMVDCPHEFAPQVDTMTADGPAPLVADAEGRYPIPMPGLITNREYGPNPS
jgi:predicted dehydrogenase